MYSLHDITSGYPKLEPASDDGECNEDDNLGNYSDGQTDTMSEEFPLDNNIMHVSVSEYNTTTNGNRLLHDRSTTNSIGLHDNISFNQASDMLSDQTTVAKTSAGSTGVSMGNFEEQIMNVYTSAPVYENGNHDREALYYQKITNERALHNRTGSKGIKVNGIYSYAEKLPQQNGTPEGLPDYRSSLYGIMPYVPMASKGGFSPYQGLSLYSGTHRSLTAQEIGVELKPCCNCPCHLQDSPQLPALDLVKNQRPSVIMVPAASKVDTVPQRVMVENAKLRGNLLQNGFHETGDSDSSDDDEDEKQEKYFRVNIDGTTARFKLTKDDWQRIPINTFPSGGRLLSGDWTRIFLSKVKESNPWCSFRFKNNHVRSENSRKIHSAVFFRGGAECKRPECNVKVRFVIRKEKGKHVDVTYVGNVNHDSQPSGSDATSGKRRKQVRRARMPQDLHD